MLVIGGLASTILVDRIAFWAVPLVAFVGGSDALWFSAAQAGASSGRHCLLREAVGKR